MKQKQYVRLEVIGVPLSMPTHLGERHEVTYVGMYMFFYLSRDSKLKIHGQGYGLKFKVIMMTNSWKYVTSRFYLRRGRQWCIYA